MCIYIAGYYLVLGGVLNGIIERERIDGENCYYCNFKWFDRLLDTVQTHSLVKSECRPEGRLVFMHS